jgi:uncharacterized membrane protein YadS
MRSLLKGFLSTEDWWAFHLGVLGVLIALLGAILHKDLTGWVVKFPLWVDPLRSLQGSHPDSYTPILSLLLTYLFFSLSALLGAYFMGKDLKRFFLSFTVLFWIGVLCFVIGQNAFLSAPSTRWHEFSIRFGLQIEEFYYILALGVGLLLGNLLPRGAVHFLQEGSRSEWLIKIAIVFLGASLGLKCIESAAKAFHILLAGISAALTAYLLFWPLAYLVSRRIFALSRDWSATLSSAVSICGVSAAIATSASIGAPAIIPTIVSALVVLFAMVELVVLPHLLAAIPFWISHPIAAGASLGLTVKTDGADAAAGAILDGLLRSQAMKMGIHWQEDWILSSAIMTKIWIDMFIGIWAFVLSVIWLIHFKREKDRKPQAIQIFWLFPKFVLGYFLAFGLTLGIALKGWISFKELKFHLDPIVGPARNFFFLLTFISIGISTRFQDLLKYKVGRVALCYGVILVFVILPLGWFIAYLFHQGMVPPYK